MAEKEVSLAKLMGAIREFRKVDEFMSLQTVETFIHIVENEGISLRELEGLVGLSQAAMSRNVQILSEWKMKDVKGHNLVKAEISPDDRRKRVCSLTAKGRRLADTLTSRR